VPVTRRRLLAMLGFGVVGGVLTGGVVGTLISNRANDAGELDFVPTSALPQVENTLAPEQKTQLIENARRCREPLGRVAIWHSTSTRGGTVSIISGSYQSPQFTLTTTPTLVALPYPAPYASGRGVLTVVGESNDFGIALRPRLITQIKGTLPIQVWWTPVGGCP
jgi:hypothetical protein